MKIKKYSNELYPYGVWVANDIDADSLTDMFTFLCNDDTEISEEDAKKMLEDDGAYATTYRIIYKKDDTAGSLIVIYRDIDIDTIAHEAGHVTQDVAEFLGFDFVSKGANEHFMYLLGWIAGRIDNFIKSK